MADFLQILVTAAAAGSIYGLLALAYLLILRPTGIINFGVGEWATVGAFAGVVLLTDQSLPGVVLPYVVALPLVVMFMALFGWASERIAVHPLVSRGAPVLSPILALLGLLIIYRESISLIFGPGNFFSPYPFGFRGMSIGPFAGTPQTFFIIFATFGVFVLVWLFFERTVWGKAFEATALNRQAAALMGINLRMVAAISFGASAAAAGLAGLMISPTTTAHYLMGLTLAIKGFSALVIGGIGRVEGALLGGYILALAERLTTRYAPIPSTFAEAVPLVLLIFFLIFRPTGLLKPRG